MQQTLTAKLQIIPQPSDRQLLVDTMKAYSATCTYVSDLIHANHLPLNIFDVQKAAYHACRESFGLRSQMAVSVTRTVVAAYKTIRTNQERHPRRFGKKKRHAALLPSFHAPQLSLVWNRDYSLVWNTDKTERFFSVNTLQGRIKCPFRADAMDRAFTEGAVYGTAKLVVKPHTTKVRVLPISAYFGTLPLLGDGEPPYCRYGLNSGSYAVFGISSAFRLMSAAKVHVLLARTAGTLASSRDLSLAGKVFMISRTKYRAPIL